MNQSTLLATVIAALAGAIAVWAVRRFLPGNTEKTQIVNQPLTVVIEKELSDKFVSNQAAREWNRRITELEGNHKGLEEKIAGVKTDLEMKIEGFALRIEDKAETRGRRIYERMDAMHSELRHEISGQTRELIAVIKGK